MSERIEHGKLRWPRAVWNALLGSFLNRKNIEFYPCLSANNQPKSLSSDEILVAIGGETKNWPSEIEKELLDSALDRARESLEEVKALTEYQDQKATRLLTVATFLTAFSGALFLRFNDAYPIKPILFTNDPRQWLIVPAYALFGLFAIAAAAGALVTFHATRTRFKYPNIYLEDETKQEKDPKSQLFYAPIVQVSPTAWARSYVAPGVDGQYALRADLQQRYLQNYVTEAYLIAAKAADKLRYLEPAQLLLSFALGCLLVWLSLLGTISIFVEPTKVSAPTSVQIETPSQPLPVRLSPPAQAPAPQPPAPTVPAEPQAQQASPQPQTPADATDTSAGNNERGKPQ